MPASQARDATHAPDGRPARHALISRALHALLALTIALLYLSAYGRKWATTQLESANWYLLVVHVNLGLLSVALSLGLLAAHLWLPQPPPLGLPRVTRLAHRGLLAVLLALPVAAYIGTGFDLKVLGQWTLPSFQRLPLADSLAALLEVPLITLMEPFGRFHRDWGADLLLPFMLGGHIAAALFHHWVLKDSALGRIWSLRR
ncbi:MAG: hypothetical protein CME82_04535 [Halomonas sp.]|mgnify:FL=1|nr:hypothetical protein [Halomonas sp.]